jgi:hypothetical protein
MEIEKYIECYEFCLDQGWVHNTPIIDVCTDYFDSTKGRKMLFENHLEKILEHQIKRKTKKIHILIGEAPPYYPNDKFPEEHKRTYFYDPKHSPATHYFRQPYKNFVRDIKQFKRTQKQIYIDKLAQRGVLILDIFPFPVFQSTDIRDEIKRGKTEDEENYVPSYYESRNSKGSFESYLDCFFKPRLEELLRKFKKFHDVKIGIYLFAPKYTSVQFLHWIKEHEDFMKYLIKFNGKFESQETLNGRVFLNDSLNEFINRLEINDGDGFCKTIQGHPIFMNGSGNPDFENFVNGKRRTT